MTAPVSAGLMIRQTRTGDRDALLSIIERTANLTNEERDCAKELLDVYLSEPVQTEYCFISALKDGVPAGYACYGNRSFALGVFDLYWIIVDEAMKGAGVGRALLDGVEQALCPLDARMLVAETSSSPAYEAARRFYQKCGFLEEARITDFYKPGDDIVFYVKRLTQKAK